MAPPYTLKPVKNDHGGNDALELSRSLRRSGLRGLVAAVALDVAFADIEAAGVQGFADTVGAETIYFLFVGRYCIAHASNPTNPEEIFILTAFGGDFAAGRDQAWQLWKTVAVPKP